MVTARPVSVLETQHRQPNHLFYLQTLSSNIRRFIQKYLPKASHKPFHFKSLLNLVSPMMLGSVAYLIGDAIADNLFGKEKKELFKFAFGLALLEYSANFHLSDEKIHSDDKLIYVKSKEFFALTNLYVAGFHLAELYSSDIDPQYKTFISLASSALVVPMGISLLVEKQQQYVKNKQYQNGSQRVDTALISAGQTSVANTFFTLNKLLVNELSSIPRLFHSTLIGINVIQDKGWIRQTRNIPSMLIDMVPTILRKLLEERKHVKYDYEKNSIEHKVLTFQKNVGMTQSIKRYQLKENDLVYCRDEAFDCKQVPVSGEVIALSDKLQSLPFRVNMKVHTGEDRDIKFVTSDKNDNQLDSVDAIEIQRKKQRAVIAGAKIDFLDNQDKFFVRIKKRRELQVDHARLKNSVINESINQFKQKLILTALAASSLSAFYLSHDKSDFLKRNITLLFTVFQVMIPLSESFLREIVNSRLLKNLNQDLLDHPLETQNVLKVVDLLNAVSGRYKKRFPSGVAIVSDKTGTLTTSERIVRGFWTKEEKQSDINFSELLYVFSCAFTNDKKENEPEEHAILKSLTEKINDPNEFSIDEVIKTNHFIKKINLKKEIRVVETLHLGLHVDFGGRFTVVNDKEHYYLIFCGIPNAKRFMETNLYNDFHKMKRRRGVLSRDWSIASAPMSNYEYKEISDYFNQGDEAGIKNWLQNHFDLLKKLNHHCTFIVDNPVKKNVENFIANARQINIPVFVATGDNAEAAENIAEVLSHDSTEQIYTFKSYDPSNYSRHILPNSTVIFAGIHPELTFKKFDELIQLPKRSRPTIIFAEMTTQNKAEIAQHLMQQGYFVVANGDGSNDIGMMKQAQLVIAHLNEEGKYELGIERYANMNDRQVMLLNPKHQSFYEAFDLHLLSQSHFIQPFIKFTNAQEMVSYALLFKTVKMSFDLANHFGFPARDIPFQPYLSIGIDAMWILISVWKIVSLSDFPVDNILINESRLPIYVSLLSLLTAVIEAVFSYQLYGQSTDFLFMALTVGMLPTVLSSLYMRLGQSDNVVAPRASLFHHAEIEVLEEDKASANVLKNKQ